MIEENLSKKAKAERKKKKDLVQKSKRFKKLAMFFL